MTAKSQQWGVGRLMASEAWISAVLTAPGSEAATGRLWCIQDVGWHLVPQILQFILTRSARLHGLRDALEPG